MLRRTRALAVVAGIVAATVPMAAAGADTPAGSSLSVTPPSATLTAARGGTLSETLRVVNLGDKPQNVSLSTTNFGAAGEDGLPEFTAHEGRYGLATWMSVEPDEATIAPHERADFHVSVKVPADGEPGSHLGAVLVHNVTARPTDARGVIVEQQVASLLLLTVKGHLVERARVASFGVPGFDHRAPVPFTARVENTGNVHVKPTGTIEVTDLLGRRVAMLPIESGNVLPGSIRRFPVKWKAGRRLGVYRAKLRLQYGRDHHVLTASTTFVGYPGLRSVGLVALGLLLVFGLRRRVWRGVRAMFAPA